MKSFIWVLGLAGLLFRAEAAFEKGVSLPYLGCGLALSLHYVIAEPEHGPAIGDILFLHGLGDAAENHAPLFKMWTDGGFRVIAVDLPSHGRTTGASLNWTTFSGFSRYLVEFLNQPKIRPDAKRPLLLSGWSTGGLLAVRLIQKKAFRNFARPVDGLVLFAPGISVKVLPGEWGRITQRTLTRHPNPEHVLPIQPTSPFWVPAFALRLKINSWLAQLGSLPTDLPTLVFFAGNQTDRYVNTDWSQRWFERQIRNGCPVWGYRFDLAYHELDNELDEVANRVRITSDFFARSVVHGDPERLMGKPAIKVVEPRLQP